MDAPGKLKLRPPGQERRRDPRAQIVRSVRIRADSVDSPVELRKTRDISRNGFFFTTHASYYYVGLRVYVVMGYEAGDPVAREWLGEVARIEKLSGNAFGIGVRILLR